MPDVRGHNEGSIFERSDGRWVAAVSLGNGQRAYRYAKSKGKAGKAEAKELLRELQRQRDAGTTTASRLTLGAYLDRWLDDVRPRLAPATWSKYEQHVRVHLGPHLGRRLLLSLSVGDVRDYLRDAVARDLDPQTARHHRSTLRRALADAIREGLLTRNVAALAEPPKLERRERPVLNAAEVRILIDGTRDDPLGALWTLLATTGLREAEALGLTWEDVDLGSTGMGRRTRDDGLAAIGSSGGAADAGIGDPASSVPGDRVPGGRALGADAPAIHVRHTLHRIDGEWQLRAPKTPKSRRTVFLPPVTVEALREHRKRQQEAWLAAGRPGALGLVFVRPDGRPYHGSKLTTLLYPVLDRLGLPRVRVHDLRHGFATLMLAEGVELITVSRMLGHSSIRITADVYSKVMPRLEQDAAERMQRAVG